MRPTIPLDPAVSVSKLFQPSRIRLTQEIPGEIHSHRELVYVEAGTLIVSTEGESCLLKAGEVLFHRPNAYHTMQAQNQAEVVLLPFDWDSPGMQALEARIFPADSACLTTILREAEQEQPGSGQMMKNALEQLLILCLRHGGTPCETRAVSASLLHQHAWVVHQVQEYLHSHFDERITLELLASRHDISVTQLKRIFKAHTGTTVITYLTDCRISRAKALIREGTLNFTQIAEAVGYDNIYYFSTQFKKQTGMTPTEYAKSSLP